MPSVKPEPDDGVGISDSIDPPPIPSFPDSSPTPDVEPQSEPQPNPGSEDKSYLQELVSATSPEKLESGVQIGLEVLEKLTGPLEAAAPLETTQASKWLKLISELKSRAKPTRTIVGVVGNTGAGKSSVISAVLDEERLLPTNCMRACTASPTEVSYNYSEKQHELYRAEVEFITSDEWVKELQALYTDLLDGNGEVSRECSNQDSEAGIAYAKIKAVYPRKTKEMISEANPRGLANEPAVRRVLGTIKSLQATTASSLYRQLQTYVDSKEKNTDHQIEYWPLIKVVRIYTKADALSTGACLVDLPGVQDSNAARAAVAANYMKACNGLWIVAPITRAVDDKTAKSLLGDSFRRQLKYDGSYSAVTFICSKTDDISVTEAAESLEMEDLIHDSWNNIQRLQGTNQELKSQLADLKEEKEACEDQLDTIDKALDQWESLSSKLSEGKTVYAPSDPPQKKRKRASKPSGSRKNRRSLDWTDDDDDDDFSDVELISDGSDKENSHPDDKEHRQPLTEEEIEEKTTALKAEKRQLRQAKKEIDQKMMAIRKDMRANTIEKNALNSEVKALCIKGRNDYSRKAIKHDFAMGIKELDQENANEEDEENFDPDVDVRDYDAVAESLPVFCVSSRAFQKLSGRMEKDNFNEAGFVSVEDTEIPQLQAHAKKLTEAGRAASCRQFLNELLLLLNSMTMWATNDGSRSDLTDGEKKAEEKNLRRQLDKMDQELESTVDEAIVAVKDALAENIYERIGQYIPRAVDAAVPTAAGWGAHRAEGGLHWSTYRATVRRNGTYTGCSGPRDFNAELFDPISVALAGGWERAFQRRLPSALENFSRTTKLLLETFHREATHRASARGNNYAGVSMLNQQLQTHNKSVSEIPNVMRAMIQELQRDANRSFTPAIMNSMIPVYETCSNESGPGTYKRMKDHMVSHVEDSRRTMFRRATDVVREQLDTLCKTMKSEMEAKVQEIHARLGDDYLAVLIGTEAGAMARMPRAERLLRSEMAPILARSDVAFAGVVSRDTPCTIRGHHQSEEPDHFALDDDDNKDTVVKEEVTADEEGIFYDEEMPFAEDEQGNHSENDPFVHQSEDDEDINQQADYDLTAEDDDK